MEEKTGVNKNCFIGHLPEENTAGGNSLAKLNNIMIFFNSGDRN